MKWTKKLIIPALIFSLLVPPMLAVSQADNSLIQRAGNWLRGVQVEPIRDETAQFYVAKYGDLYVPYTIVLPGGPGSDSFGRMRVARPETLFDSKQLLDNNPLLWDDQEVSGGSTTSAYSVNKAASTMGVALNTAGLRVRQTFRRFNYQSGKSQQAFMTGNLQLSGGGTGITAGMGYIDDNNGLALVNKEGVPNWRLRSKVSESVVDIDVPVGTAEGRTTAASGAILEVIDSFDGSGPSGITFDKTKSVLFAINFEWLSVGTVVYSLIYERTSYPALMIHNAGKRECR